MATKTILVRTGRRPKAAISDLIVHLDYLYPDVVGADPTAAYLLRMCIAQLQAQCAPKEARHKATEIAGLKH